MATDLEERRKNRRLYKPEQGDIAKQLRDEDEAMALNPSKAFDDHKLKAKQILFREREVDNLMSMIYGATHEQSQMDTTDFDEEEDERVIDTHRFDVAAEKLAMYKRPAVKRKLKSKFVTGQNSEQIV